ncbi:B3 domain-containing protein Os12g0591400-like [Arachis duranensis]|uniref:B3 domain-containing protein Os12g0591400-like n=1 Tax=Arachis duranensis TaxID=130453 RepID=A0A6P4C073_ARADU|nr:B3 domain-containing protein Os12g0591400-like [Arachis duranensis]
MVANTTFITLQKLPIKFTKKYGSDLSNPLYLKPPDGTEWSIEWINHDGEILFKNGWKEFVAYYSLDHGHLLRFGYNIGTSHMEVHIFDMSCLQIEYPANDQIKEQLPRRGQQPIGSWKMTHKSRMWKEALILTMKFNWEKPSFIIKITQRSQTRAPCYFSTKFFRKYFINNPQNANIRFGKKLFPVKLIYRPSSCVAFISAGWNLFARASKLQAGDICLFKLINKKDPMLDVHICRRQRRESLKPVTHGIQLFKEVKELNSQNPSFMVKIRDSNPRRSRPNLSAIFYRKYFKKNQQDVKLQFGKESWPATIIYNPTSKNSFISVGWSSFARASKLEAGDVCVFELINKKDLFDVHICRTQY